jgi:rhodanese-related sulfurtransferase
MNAKRLLLEILALVAAAVVCASGANLVAAHERRVAFVGTYPDALKVPPESAAPAPAPMPVTSAPSSAAPAPAASSTSSSSASNGDVLARFPPHKDKPYVEVSGDDVKFLHGAGVLFLDARRTAVYEEGHIANARPMPIWESDVDQRVMALLGEGRDMTQPVVLYCSGGDCEDSHMLAQKLWGAGFENLLVYKDGFPDWQKRGGAVHKGGAP